LSDPSAHAKAPHPEPQPTRRMALADLLAAFVFERPPEEKTQKIDVFLGPLLQAGWKRTFGGFVLAQTLAAACRTVTDRQAHVLHGLFLRPGDPALPIHFEVEHMRDGQSFGARQCRALQDGVEIFEALVSFHREETGFDHAETMPAVLPPEAEILKPEPLFEREGYKRWFALHEGMVEMRPVQKSCAQKSTDAGAGQQRLLWLRAAAPLPDDPAIHRAVLAYMSDMSLLDCALVAHEKSVFDADVQAASLDHALWFHRPFRADEWLLYAQESPTAAGGRGLTRGTFYSADGRLIASVVQEGLIRPRF